jgi:D-amino-acid oxidase
MSRRKKVVVIGGGVVGLTCAFVLSEEHEVTVVAELVGASSDSRKATAVWHVYLVPETPDVLSWAQSSLEKLCDLAIHEPQAGVELVRGVELFRKVKPHVPIWSNIPRLFKMLTKEEIAHYNKFSTLGLSKMDISALQQNPVRWGYHIEAPAACMQRYLSWLETNTAARCVKIQRKRISAFETLSMDYDVIINCTGFGARELARDRDFVAYKGQYFVLKGSHISPRTYIGDDDHPGGMAYVIPRLGEVLVGGCAERGREDLELTLDWKDTIKRAGLFVPWLRACCPTDQAREPVVGIRPCRTAGVRLDIDLVSASIPIIHNYGHGGSGFSLSWGCAAAVKALVAAL